MAEQNDSDEELHEEWADLAMAMPNVKPDLKTHKVNLITKHKTQRATYQPSLWCLDSGGTTHLTGDPSIFDVINEYNGILTNANGQTIKIKGKGTVTFRLPNVQSVRLGEVLYISGARENLISMDLLLDNGIEHSCTKKR